VIHRGTEADLIEPELDQRLLGRVLRRQPDDERGRDAAEGDAVFERARRHALLVEMTLRSVHHQVREQHVVHLGDGAAARVLVDRAHGEVLEIIVLAGERCEAHRESPRESPRSRSEMTRF
jgi:hypothetical protein